MNNDNKICFVISFGLFHYCDFFLDKGTHIVFFLHQFKYLCDAFRQLSTIWLIYIRDGNPNPSKFLNQEKSKFAI